MPEPTGWEIAVRLLQSSRALVDELHARLERRGHPGLRPAHGYAFQAVGRHGTTSSALARDLGVTKQAAGQLVDELTRKGYLRRVSVEEDRRQKLIVLTDRGEDCLRQSAAIFAELHAEWAQHVGTERLRDLDRDLNTLLTLYQRPGQGLRPVW